MTLSISDERRSRARRPPSIPDSTQRSLRILRGVQIFTVATATLSLASLTAAFTLGEWRTAVAGIVLAVLATAGGALWCMRNLLADREEFYRRGQLDGWFKGWRGQEPDTDDPLLHP